MALARIVRMLGWLFVPIVAFVLLTSECQDRALKGQVEATEFFAWAAGVGIARYGVVVGYPRPGCMQFKLDDPFPIGERPVFCGDRLPLGTRVRLVIRGSSIFSIEILRDGDEE